MSELSPICARLQLQRASFPDDWNVRGTSLQLSLCPSKKRWYLRGREPDAQAWVRAHGLSGPFRTRGDLLELIQSASERAPIPPAPPLPRLKRASPGLYLSECGRMRVEREEKGWLVKPQQGLMSRRRSGDAYHARTLALAALRVSHAARALLEAGDHRLVSWCR